MIRVGIDARLTHFPGVGRYIRCLLRGLSVHRDGVEPVVYLRPEETLPFNGLEVRRVRVPPFSVAEQIFWSIRIARDGLHVFHAPHYVFPLLTPCRLVVTLHDVVYFRYPPQGTRLAGLRAYYRLMNRAAAIRADAIITVSEFSRRELSQHLRVNLEKVFVIANAVEPHMRPQPEDVCRAVRERYQLPNAFTLYVGTNKPWKNMKSLLKAFARASRARPECALVIAGKRGRNEEELGELIRELGLKEQVMQIGEVDEVDLPALYSAARVVVCPSLYEGFGLTALEAMACGTPVISSNAASLPEVVNGAAILLEPLDEQGWADAIIRLWDDPSLRAALRAAGLARARQFTVERMACETVSVYKRLLLDRKYS